MGTQNIFEPLYVACLIIRSNSPRHGVARSNRGGSAGMVATHAQATREWMVEWHCITTTAEGHTPQRV